MSFQGANSSSNAAPSNQERANSNENDTAALLAFCSPRFTRKNFTPQSHSQAGPWSPPPNVVGAPGNSGSMQQFVFGQSSAANPTYQPMQAQLISNSPFNPAGGHPPYVFAPAQPVNSTAVYCVPCPRPNFDPSMYAAAYNAGPQHHGQYPMMYQPLHMTPLISVGTGNTATPIYYTAMPSAPAQSAQRYVYNPVPVPYADAPNRMGSLDYGSEAELAQTRRSSSSQDDLDFAATSSPAYARNKPMGSVMPMRHRTGDHAAHSKENSAHMDDNQNGSSAATPVNMPSHGQDATSGKEYGRTPLFGSQPAWWGELDHEASAEDNVQRRPHKHQNLEDHSYSLNSGISGRSSASPKQNSAARPVSVPSRNVVVADEDSTRDQQSTETQRPRTESTAFTIEFANDDSSSPHVTTGARNAVRRSLGASELHSKLCAKPPFRGSRTQKSFEKPKFGGVNSIQAPSTEVDMSCKAKDYLLSKMLGEPGAVIPDATPTTDVDNDRASDAGTYTVDRERCDDGALAIELNARRDIGKVFGLESDESFVSERSEGTMSNSDSLSTQSPPKTADDATTDVAHNAEIQASTTEGSKTGKGLFERFKRMNDSALVAPKKDASKVATGSGTKVTVPVPLTRKSQSFVRAGSVRTPSTAAKDSVPGKSPQSPLNRSDAGRMSLRPTASDSNAGSNNKTVGASSTEMTNWLRRKEYNPLRESKKQRATATEPQYLKNRSTSFHYGSGKSNVGDVAHDDSAASNPDTTGGMDAGFLVSELSRNISENMKLLSAVDDPHGKPLEGHSTVPTGSSAEFANVLHAAGNLSRSADRLLRKLRTNGELPELWKSVDAALFEASTAHQSHSAQMDHALRQLQGVEKILDGMHEYFNLHNASTDKVLGARCLNGGSSVQHRVTCAKGETFVVPL